MTAFAFVLSAANLVLYHQPLLAFGAANIDYRSWGGLATVATIVLVATATVLIVLALVSVRVLKAFAIVAALGNAVALHFITTYRVIFDKSMMGNVFDTSVAESAEFLHPVLVAWVLLLGAVQAWLIVRTKVRPVPRVRLPGHAGANIVLLAAVVYANAGSALWIDEHAKRLGGLIVPWSYVFNAAKVRADRSRADATQRLLPDVVSATDERVVVALVIGETARAANFSLYGYARPTNPLLGRSDIVVLPDATACSTYTTASLHCMLSHDGSSDGPDEPLPSYLHRSNVDVVWRTANWGEPPIEVDSYEKASELRAACVGEGCDHDEVLLTGLVNRIRASGKRKVFVALHTKGSHGSAYDGRYPPRLRTFAPVCASVELDKCSEAELVNAYDNTIVYTDRVLARTIEQLEVLGDVPVLMMYVSDHGESLGEYGLYLHGTPWALAPDVQKRIPFLLWMSPAFRRARNVDAALLERGSHSHDQVFHSVLGALGLTSPVYDENLDLFHT